MRFTLIDHVVQLQPDASITAVKSLAMSEEYLAEHFPGFPVMPGVLMLEALTQTGAWLIRASEDFAHRMIVLQEARNVKYGRFVEPGQTLTLMAEIFRQDERVTDLKARGVVDGRTVVGARLILRRYNLADSDPGRAATDRRVVEQLRDQCALLCRPRTVSGRGPVT